MKKNYDIFEAFLTPDRKSLKTKNTQSFIKVFDGFYGEDGVDFTRHLLPLLENAVIYDTLGDVDGGYPKLVIHLAWTLLFVTVEYNRTDPLERKNCSFNCLDGFFKALDGLVKDPENDSIKKKGFLDNCGVESIH